jgi:uncharacterized membrane protein (DUF2068 family)
MRAPTGEQLIVWYKFGKTALELAVAVAVTVAASGVAARWLPIQALGPALNEHLATKWARIVEAALSGVTASRMHLAAAALAADGLSSLVEGWGVWRGCRWATWVVVGATGGLIPLELALIVEKPSAVRLIVLAINVATVAYMIGTRSTRMDRRRHGSWRRRGSIALGMLASYACLAYVVLPWSLRQRAASRALDGAPDWADDGLGHPSDAVNVGLVGTQEEVIGAMQKAGWRGALALSPGSALGIGEGVLLDRSDPDAPVSNLYLDGRRQDLAFEQQVGGSPRRRHHVRFWLRVRASLQGRPLWLGAATYDRGVGFARDTGQITHVIDPDIDAERDKLIADLIGSACVTDVHWVQGVGRIEPNSHERVYTGGLAVVAVLLR